MPYSKTNDLARRLVSVESGPGNEFESTQFVAFRVCDKLRQPLSLLAGVPGYRALLSRALTLAKSEVPWLKGVHVTADGSLERPADSDQPIDEVAAREGGVILLSHLLGLFLGLIGADLTLKMVRELAPDFEAIGESVAPMPAETLLQEVFHLNNVSSRLDAVAGQHPVIEDALTSISGNIRNTATTLEVFVLLRNPSNRLPQDAPKPSAQRYKM